MVVVHGMHGRGIVYSKDNVKNRWIAEVFMGECIGNNGKKGILAVKHLDLDQEGQLDGRNVYVRCTPYLRSGEDYCTGSNDRQYFDVELFL